MKRSIEITLQDEPTEVDFDSYIESLNDIIKQIPSGDLTFKSSFPFSCTIGNVKTTGDYEYRRRNVNGDAEMVLAEVYLGKADKVIYRFVMKKGVGQTVDINNKPMHPTVYEMNERDGLKVFNTRFSAMLEAINAVEFTKAMRSVKRKAKAAEKEEKMNSLLSKIDDPEFNHIGSW